MTHHTIRIHTDGACSSNGSALAVGGWGAILDNGSRQLRISGREEPTTNQRMEMTAVIKALEALKGPRTVALYTDSRYIVSGVNEWLANWKARGWKKANKKAVENLDLWQRLDALLQVHSVSFHWVKGHNGDPMNELADSLATAAIRKGCTKRYFPSTDTGG